MARSDTVQMRRRFFDVVLNTGDPAAVDTFIAPDFVNHTPFPGSGPGREGFRSFLPAFHTAFPDAVWTPLDMVAHGDKVATLYRLGATNSGPLAGRPATGRRVSILGMDLVRMRDGKMVEHWGVSDTLSMSTQLGWLDASPS